MASSCAFAQVNSQSLIVGLLTVNMHCKLYFNLIYVSHYAFTVNIDIPLPIALENI